MRLQEVMRREVRVVSRNGTLEEARALMRLYQVRHLVVVEGERVVGVLSERDLGGTKGGAVRMDGLVERAMAASPVTAPPTTTVRKAANLMRGRRIGCLPVIDNGRLVGIVTDTDLLGLIGRGVEAPSPRKTRAILRRRRPERRVGQR